MVAGVTWLSTLPPGWTVEWDPTSAGVRRMPRPEGVKADGVHGRGQGERQQRRSAARAFRRGRGQVGSSMAWTAPRPDSCHDAHGKREPRARRLELQGVRRRAERKRLPGTVGDGR
uniref:Uncharacterized protein n=1 Tax=Zea mays TaxID=4577 RepID=C0PLP2_MAIZE|nr:unknown [Zea mays]